MTDPIKMNKVKSCKQRNFIRIKSLFCVKNKYRNALLVTSWYWNYTTQRPPGARVKIRSFLIILKTMVQIILIPGTKKNNYWDEKLIFYFNKFI